MILAQLAQFAGVPLWGQIAIGIILLAALFAVVFTILRAYNIAIPEWVNKLIGVLIGVVVIVIIAAIGIWGVKMILSL